MSIRPIAASKQEKTFRMECAVRGDIRATPARIWSLLTNAAEFPRWNSTVAKIDGQIQAGQTLRLVATASPGRTFTPKVTRFEPERAMEWSDGFAPMFKGVRTFTLTPKEDGVTEFEMIEVFSGAMLPMIKGSLPDFVPLFETYASDLKRAAEAV
jgi:hypothetical protein